jgi:Ca2+-binding RTX toxin-like protein
MPGTRIVAVLAAAAVGAALGLTVASPAHAAAGSTANVGGDGNLHYDGLPGFTNTVVITKAGTTVDIDDSVTITPSGACSHPNPMDDTVVTCTVAAVAPDLMVEPGDLNDRVTIISDDEEWHVDLGSGSDTADLTDLDGSGSIVVGGTGNDLLISGPEGEMLDGGDGTDTVSYATRQPGVPVAVDLGAGQGGNPNTEDGYEDIENLIGTPSGDVLTGDDGPNRIDGGGGWDGLHGEGGDDLIIGGTGLDVIDGGTGTDTASYLGHPAAVTATLDGQQNDGVAGELDWIQIGVENLAGSSYGDSLTGNSSVNVIHGDACSLFCFGSGGDDTILGGGSNDFLYGGDGDDYLHGQAGSDTLVGNDGDDDLYGGSSADTLSGGNGDDYLSGASGYDGLDGGSGLADWCYTDDDGGTKTGCEFPLVVVWP